MMRLSSRLPNPLKNDAGLQPLDLLLSGASSIVAVYAAAASLASDKNAQFFMWIVMIGTLCSSLMVWFFGKSKFIFADTTAYTLVALLAVFGISNLNGLAPEAIYTGPLSMAGILSWMLALGSFTVWRDQTMLFQAVPCVALFGLVGCYDTFRASVIYFFIFLICQATLMARAHGRVMLRQARSSGVEALELSAMRKGPWRWMAGPEWALGSALTIVLISVIGAPLLRESAKSFSGLVRYTPPVSPLAQSPLAAASSGGTRIGTGPTALHDSPVLRIAIPQPMYLRSFAYGRYEAGTWFPRAALQPGADQNAQNPWQMAVDEIKDKREITFRVEPLQVASSVVPVPGEVELLIGDSPNYYWRNIGSSFSIREQAPFPPLEGRAAVASGRTTLTSVASDIARVIPEYLQTAGIPTEVAQLAADVSRNAKTDAEKAYAIKAAIENRVKYNINAGATPQGQDPVSYFLFDSKEGYCDLFASTMTLMARSVGLPARYVTGYFPFDANRDDSGRFLVRQKDAHAWCEIYFKDAGWVVFDATEGAVSVDGGERGQTNDKPFWKQAWFAMIVIFGLGAAAAYGLFFVVGNYLRFRSSPAFAQRHVTRATLKLKSQMRKQYLSFERELRRAARRPRGIGETILEYVTAAKAGLGSRTSLAMETGFAFASVLYAQSTIEQGAIEDLKARVADFKKARRSKDK